MKKWLKVLIVVVAIVITCAIVITISALYIINKKLKSDKTFDMADCTITLTGKFTEIDAPEDADWLLNGYDVCVMGSYEKKTDLKMSGWEIESHDEYIDLWIENTSSADISEPHEYNGIKYSEYTGTVDGISYSFMAVFYESSYAYHVITFWCTTSDYSEYKLQFLTWADTVEFKE